MLRHLYLGSLALAVGSVLFTSPSLVHAEEAAAAATPKVTFADDVLPIFRAKCGSCHNASDKKGGLVLDNYAAMMLGGSSGTVIEAGDAGNSYLWNLITHASEPKMPPNADKLPADQLAVIEKWITLGALENAGSKAAMKKKPTLAKIEVTSTRPADVAIPQKYLGEPVYVPSGTNAVTALAVSPWASLAAVSGYKQIAIYDTKTLDQLGVLPFPEGKAQIAKFSRNGSLLLVGGGRGGESGRVVVYDVRTGERKAELGEEYDEVLAADISSDQTMIALGGPKKMLRVYSIATGELLYENKKHTDWITSIEFSPDGVLLASGDRSNGLVVWEAGSGLLFYDLQGHKGSVNDVSWRPDSNVVASGSDDKTVKLWEMQNGGMIKSFEADAIGVTAVEFTREGDIVTTGRGRVTRYWKGDGTKIRDLPAVSDMAMEVAFDAETKRILTGDWTGAVTIWNADDATPVGTINTNPVPVKTQLELAAATLTQVKGQLQAQQAAMAAVQKGISDRQKVATDRAGILTKNEETVKTSAAARGQAEAGLKAQQANMVTADKTMKDSQAAEAALKTQSQQLAEKVKAAQAAHKTHSDAFAATTQELATATTTLANLTAKADAALKASEPTEAEKGQIETDEAVKKVIAERQQLAKDTAAAVTPAEQAKKALTEKVAAVQKLVADAQAQVAASVQEAGKVQEQVVAATAANQAAVKGLEAARKATEAAQAQVAAAVQQEQVATKSVAAAKIAATQATEAAKPTADEQKKITETQAAIDKVQSQLAAAEAKIARLQKIQAELAKPVAVQ